MDGPFDTYLSHCRRYCFPPPWDALTADSRAYLGPADPRAALDELIATHSRETLLSSKLVVAEADGSLALHPFLTTANTVLLGFEESEPQGVTNLLTNEGCLSGDRWPFVAAMRDRRTQELLVTEPQLLLTADLETTILLKNMEVAAAPIGPMATLSRGDLELLRNAFGTTCTLSHRESERRWATQREFWGPPPPPSSDDDDPTDDPSNEGPPYSRSNSGIPPSGCAPSGSVPSGSVPSDGAESDKDGDVETAQPVLVAWSPFSMSADAPPAIGAAIGRLNHLANCVGLSTSEFSIWTPTAAQLGRIQVLLAERDEGWIQDAVLDSFFAEMRCLAARQPVEAAAAAPIDLAAAADMLCAASQIRITDDAVISRRKRQEAAATYRRIAVEELVNPLLRTAQLEHNSVRRLQRNMLGELTRLYVSMLPSVMADVGSDRTDGGVLGPTKTRASVELLGIFGRITSLIKDLTR